MAYKSNFVASYKASVIRQVPSCIVPVAGNAASEQGMVSFAGSSYVAETQAHAINLGLLLLRIPEAGIRPEGFEPDKPLSCSRPGAFG
jgi:hypothetical protein